MKSAWIQTEEEVIDQVTRGCHRSVKTRGMVGGNPQSWGVGDLTNLRVVYDVGKIIIEKRSIKNPEIKNQGDDHR